MMARKFFLFLLLLAFAGPLGATSYYMSPANTSPAGNDKAAGTAAAPWASPDHPLNCGDTITASTGSYSASNFADGKWGTVSCSAGNNVAWIKCATFDACKISSTSLDGMWVDKSYWGVQGFEITVTGGANGACFHAGPSSGSGGIVHHVIFANDVANGCRGGGMAAYSQSATASVDYIAFIGNIAYNTVQGSMECYSGFNIFQPLAYNTQAGTHIYVAGNFAYNNVDANPCDNETPTDGEGINFDTFQGGPYTQQAVVENNIAIFNGGRGIYAENNAASTPAMIYFKNNTLYGNNSQLSQQYCLGNGDLAGENVLNLTAEYNLVQTDSATMCKTPETKYAMSVSNANNGAVTFDYNYADGVSGNNMFIYNASGFAYGSHNVIGTSAEFSHPTAPPAPNCAKTANVPACMATVVADFTPDSAASKYGYQKPSATSVTDPLYPQWLCTANLPSGLVTPGCGN